MEIFEYGTRPGGSKARLEKPLQGAVDLGLRDVASLHSVYQRSVLGAAGEVRSRRDRRHRRLAQGGRVLVIPMNVAQGPAIADDVAPEAPLLPQPPLQQVGAGAAGRSVDGVVDTHDRPGLAFHDGRAERR
jgi:hypothetical protein